MSTSKDQEATPSLTSTTKKISPQATQAWLWKGSRRFWACFFGRWLEKGRGCPWRACGTMRNRTSTYPHTPGFEGQSQPQLESQRPIGKQRACPEAHVSSHRTFIFERGPPKNNLFWRNRAFFPVASRSNPRCSEAQIASYWAQIGRFLALAPQRMSHLFGKNRVFFGDNVNVFNFWISLKKPVIKISLLPCKRFPPKYSQT